MKPNVRELTERLVYTSGTTTFDKNYAFFGVSDPHVYTARFILTHIKGRFGFQRYFKDIGGFERIFMVEELATLLHSSGIGPVHILVTDMVDRFQPVTDKPLRTQLSEEENAYLEKQWTDIYNYFVEEGNKPLFEGLVSCAELYEEFPFVKDE